MSTPKRSGPLSTLAMLVFALPFLVVGMVTVFAGLADLLGGNDRSWPALPFGALFFGAGAFVVRVALRERRSRESLAAKEAAEEALRAGSPDSEVVPVSVVRAARNYRSPAGTARSAREVYGPLLAALPLPVLEPRPGEVLASEISLHAAQSSGVELFVALLWNGLVWPFFVVSVASGSILLSLFLLLFVGVGAHIFVASVKRLLGRMRLPRVELSAEPAYLGDELRVHVDQRGPARITRYRVGVRCEEIVSFSVGTDTRTETHEVYDATLYDEPGGPRLGLGEHWTHDLSLVLPVEAPASFQAPHNRVLWTVRVHAEIAGWPDYDEGFAFRALPRPAP